MEFKNADNVKDLLDGLKKDVLSLNEEWDQKWGALDNHVEAIFDKYAENNKQTIQDLIQNNKIDELEKILDDLVDNDPTVQAFLNEIEAITTNDIVFDLNRLSLDILKSSIKQNNTSSNNPNGIPTSTAKEDEYWNGANKIRDEYKSTHEFIDKDPKNRSYQSLSPLSWNEDLDANGDKKLTKSELKKAGILDRYRQSDTDIRKAVQTILQFADGEFKKKDIQGVDRQSLGAILDDVIKEYYEQSNTRDPKEFKKYFKDNFVKNKEYKKR